MFRRKAAALLGVALAALGAAGCGGTEQFAVSHRHSPLGETRIVVLPVHVREGIVAGKGEGKTLANLYATQLLKAYEILEYERFRHSLEKRQLSVDSLLVNGTGEELSVELGVDSVLLSEVYSWRPGTPGFWFLAKAGRIGFSARLVDLRTGSVIWSVNRVRETGPGDPLSHGVGLVVKDLIAEMPAHLTPY